MDEVWVIVGRLLESFWLNCELFLLTLLFALPLGALFSVIQITEGSVQAKRELVRRYGLQDRCASVRSIRIAPTNLRIEASLGKIPTTSVRRLISPFRRSIGFVLCNFARCWAGKVM